MLHPYQSRIGVGSGGSILGEDVLVDFSNAIDDEYEEGS